MKFKAIGRYLLYSAITLVTLLTVALSSVHYYSHRTVSDEARTITSGEMAYYFAYGSNMSTRYLANVRHIKPLNSTLGRIKNHEVSFSLPGFSMLEPSFAGMTEKAGSTAWGVLHTLNRDSLDKIKTSESDKYTWKKLPVILSDGLAVNAWTLVSPVTEFRAPPSQRYLDILLEGMNEHNFPAHRMKEIESIDGVYTHFLSEIFGAVIQGFVICRTI